MNTPQLDIPLASATERQSAGSREQLAVLVRGVGKVLSGGGREKEFHAELAYQLLCKVMRLVVLPRDQSVFE